MKIENPQVRGWYAAKEPECEYDDLSDCLMDNSDMLVPIEVIGVASVERKFAVRHPIGDDEDEVRMFDTADEADAFVDWFKQQDASPSN
jgi:hypothetical protein